MSQQEQEQRRHRHDGEPFDARREQQSRSIRAGTKVVTKSMKRFVTPITRDGQYNFDLSMTYGRIETAAKFIKRMMAGGPDKVLVFSSKDIARESVIKFCDDTGTTAKTGRFMPGTLTNPSLPYYTEPTLVVVSDPQLDAQAVTEATNAGIPVVGISSTESIPSKIDLIIPANNRDRKAIESVYKRLSQDISESHVDARVDRDGGAAEAEAEADAAGGAAEAEAEADAAGGAAEAEAEADAAGGAAEADAAGGAAEADADADAAGGAASKGAGMDADRVAAKAEAVPDAVDSGSAGAAADGREPA